MKQFIEVTDKDNMKYLININNIVAVYQDKEYCLIVLSNADFIHNKLYLPVKESYEKIKELISQSQ